MRRAIGNDVSPSLAGEHWASKVAVSIVATSLSGRRGRPPARPEVPDRIEVVMNVRVFLGYALLLFALALVSSCSTKAKSPLQPSTKLAGSSLDAAAVFGGSAREGGFGAFEPRDLGGGGGSRLFTHD